jgi:hypothetical protein
LADPNAENALADPRQGAGRIPSVASLRLIRQAAADRPAAATVPLLAFADPLFGPDEAAQPARPDSPGDFLRRFPPPLRHRVEAEASRSGLGAPAESVISGKDASRTCSGLGPQRQPVARAGG